MCRLITWIPGFFVLILATPLWGGTHLQQLKSRYPYGLIGDDYGLLSADDLAVNTRDVEVTPFSKDKNMAYSYWQCFRVKNTKISCESMGEDASETNETGYLEISSRNSEGVHSYLARNAIKMSDCRKRLKIWNQSTAGEKNVCLSGSFATFEKTSAGNETSWVLDKFKTHRGCESFGLPCEL